MSDEKSVPVLVKVLAIFHYVGAGLIAIVGLTSIFFLGLFSIVLGTILPDFFSELGGFALIGMILPVFLSLGFAVLYFFIGRGLWKAQNWARILVIVSAGLGVLATIIYLLLGMFKPVVDSIPYSLFSIGIALYLLLNKKVKEAFE